MKYNEIPEFKNGLPEWLYNLKEEERQKYDFRATDKGYIAISGMEMLEYTKAEQEKYLDKNNEELKKNLLKSTFLTLILIGIVMIFSSPTIKLMKIIAENPTPSAIIFITIGSIGLFVLLRKKHDN